MSGAPQDSSPTCRSGGLGRLTRRTSGPSRSRLTSAERKGHGDLWPAKIKDKGGIRWQFHHVIDIVPTLLEVDRHSGTGHGRRYRQKPIEGVSMAYTFDKANANAPSQHTTQYFEMLSVQGLYNDGWMLSADPIRAPWELRGSGPRSCLRLQV